MLLKGFFSHVFGARICSQLFGSLNRHCSLKLCRRSHVLVESIQTDSVYGQPSPRTHPHLLREGEVTPGLSRQEYNDRRHKLMEYVAHNIHKKGLTVENHVVIIPSARKVFMSDKIPYPFRQNTDFLYLSGFQESDSVLLLHSLPKQRLPQHKSVVFVQKRCRSVEKWEGPRSGTDGAIELLGVDGAENIENLEKYLNQLAKNCGTFVLWYDHNQKTFPLLHEIMANYIASYRPVKVNSPVSLIHELRLIKSESEMKLMKHSAEIACQSMKEVMHMSHPEVEESHLWAKMDFDCRIRGAERLAYPPVVAGGKRANIIHYISNNQRISAGDLVLMDAGCEFHGYSSDLTRSWPISGQFSPHHRELYEALLDVQMELIQQCISRPSLDHLFHIMCQLIGTKLQELSLLPRSANKIEITKMAYDFCPHHVGHYLGMDVHDTTSVPRNIPLQPGMVFTIEPGIYIDENIKSVPEVFRGIGMRIEDDLFVTDSGIEVLTATCPKSVSDIENILKQPIKIC